MTWGSRHSRVQRAMRSVQRELFLPESQRRHAAEDAALPIDCEQTISQPSLVAEMTVRLRLTDRSRVLEIGTGSGYQTAILAELAREVFTVERIAELADAARARLGALGYDNIHFRLGDGALGWPEAAPFDAIIVTAAAATLPAALLGQLGAGGCMVVPLGAADADDQMLWLLQRDAAGNITETELCGVRFVPLISDAEGGRGPARPH